MYPLDFNYGIFTKVKLYVYVNLHSFEFFLMASHHGFVHFFNTINSFANNFDIWQLGKVPQNGNHSDFDINYQGALSNRPQSLVLMLSSWIYVYKISDVVSQKNYYYENPKLRTRVIVLVL